MPCFKFEPPPKALGTVVKGGRADHGSVQHDVWWCNYCRFPSTSLQLVPADPWQRALARMFVKAVDATSGVLYGAVRNAGAAALARHSAGYSAGCSAGVSASTNTSP